MKPLILINFKTYKEASGNKSLALARQLARIKRKKYQIAVAPSLLTLKEITKVNIPVYAQHTDLVGLGAHTGRVPAKELKDIGVKGTILNHSERKIPLKILQEIIQNCKTNRLTTVVCASTISEIKKIAQFNPDYIAYEPKELIGGNISVTESKPDIILEAVQTAHEVSKRIKVLVGAGIHSKEDIGQALLLGAEGVLIGHAVPKAKDPKKFLEGLLI